MTHSFGTTSNFAADTTDGYWGGISTTQQANVAANANFLLGKVEAAFTTTTGWFGTDTSKFGSSNRQEVAFDQPDNSGAFNTGYGNAIHIDPQSGDGTIATAGPIVCMLWMAEWSEVLMSLTGNWNAGDSSGEGLSQYSATQLFLDGHKTYYRSFVGNWLNGDGTTNPGTASPNAARSDWVNTTFTGADVGGTHVNGDGDPVSFGCAFAFIYYLTVQLGFSINEVIANYSGNLASSYHAVTGDGTDPFPAFAGILAHVFPPSQTASLTGNNPDNQFPIAQVWFYAQKNTFGKDEAQDIIDHQGGLISSAFWLVIDGLSQRTYQNLDVQVLAFTGAFAGLSGVQIATNALGVKFQNGVHPKSPQRIRIPFDITLTQPFIGHFPASGVSAPLDLATSLFAQSTGSAVSGSSATMDFELIAAGDPYFANIDPGADNQPYLSQDLRVFGAAPAVNDTPFPGGPTFTNDSPTGAISRRCSPISTARPLSSIRWAPTRSRCCPASRARARPTARLLLSCSRPPSPSPTITTSRSRGCAYAARPALRARPPTCGCSSACSPARAPIPTTTRTGPICRSRTRRTSRAHRCPDPARPPCRSSPPAMPTCRPTISRASRTFRR